jgi:hypothetical protein
MDGFVATLEAYGLAKASYADPATIELRALAGE